MKHTSLYLGITLLTLTTSALAVNSTSVAIDSPQVIVQTTYPANNQGWVDRTNSPVYISMDSVNSLNENISSIQPTFNWSTVPDSGTVDYLSSDSCLGYLGPIGPYGPLGTLGPLWGGTADLEKFAWNTYAFLFGNSETFNDFLKSLNYKGDLSSSGPLGSTGPLATNIYYSGSAFLSNDFNVQLRGMGLFTALGPLGPLGALGPLGPLGPLNLSNFATKVDTNGNYYSGSSIIRQVTVPYDTSGNTRTYPLYEKYDSDYAQNMTDNDTSFCVNGTGTDDKFAFTSNQNQLVTVVVIPSVQYASYKLTIENSAGKILASSDSSSDAWVSGEGYINFIQMAVPAGTSLIAHVSYEGSIGLSSYYLYVTGSTQYTNMTNISGKMILPLTINP